MASPWGLNIAFDPARFSHLRVVPRPHKLDSTPIQPEISVIQAVSSSPTFRNFHWIYDSVSQQDSGPPFNGFDTNFQPFRLQRRLWHFAACGPRIVEVHTEDFYIWATGTEVAEDERTSDLEDKKSHTFDQRLPILPFRLLRTCRESRDVPLRFDYKKEDLVKEYFTDSIYFEYGHDTMYFTREFLLYCVSTAHYTAPAPPRNCYPNWTNGITMIWHSLRSIAVNAESLLDDPSKRSQELVENLWVFQNLEETVLVLNDDLRISCHSKLSTIQYHEPRPGSEATDILNTLADEATEVYLHRFREDIVRSTGILWEGEPLPEPCDNWTYPKFRTTVTHLTMN